MARQSDSQKGRSRKQFSEAENASTYSGATRKVFALFVIAACLTAIVPVIPQWKELAKIQSSLEETQAVERRMAAEEERYLNEQKALEENRFYLESRARDRLHRYLPGEKVVRMEE